MSITVRVVSPYGVVGGRLPYAFRQTQPPEELTIEYGYRFANDPGAVRLVPVPKEQVISGARFSYRKPIVVFPETRSAEMYGIEHDASFVSWPSQKVLARLTATPDGQKVAEGRPQPYRLSADELAAFDGRTLRLALNDLDAQW